MTDELDPQTQQHIDHSEDAVDDCDTPTCVDASTDAPATADAHAGADKATDTDDTVAVSYTHLTLPTNSRV